MYIFLFRGDVVIVILKKLNRREGGGSPNFLLLKRMCIKYTTLYIHNSSDRNRQRRALWGERNIF